MIQLPARSDEEETTDPFAMSAHKIVKTIPPKKIVRKKINAVKKATNRGKLSNIDLIARHDVFMYFWNAGHMSGSSSTPPSNSIRLPICSHIALMDFKGFSWSPGMRKYLIVAVMVDSLNSPSC